MSELKEAFREAARRQFAMVPAEEDLDWVFSAKFERKMRRMIRAQEYGYWNLVNTTAKRVAIAAAIIVMLLSTAMAIKPIRERVIKFFIDVYEDYFEIHFGEKESWDLPERTEPMIRYTLTELPEGYEEVECVELDSLIWTSWQNEKGMGISLQQEPGTNEITLDNMETPLLNTEYGGSVISYQENVTTYSFVWVKDEYIFYLNVHKEIALEEIEKMIVSLEKRK